MQFYNPNSVYYMYTTIADQKEKESSCENSKPNSKKVTKSAGSFLHLEINSDPSNAANRFLDLPRSQLDHLQGLKHPETRVIALTVCP